MPTEINRVLARKQIDVGNGQLVDVPVIQEITFKDPVQRAQETVYTLNNGNTSSRVGHAHTVVSQLDSGTTLNVERPDEVLVKDPVQRAQETDIGFVNLDPPPARSLGDVPAHQVVHYVRYCQGNDQTAASWIDMEVIDQYWNKDPVNRAQETRYTLTNNPPDIGDSFNDGDLYKPSFAQCDLTLPLLNFAGLGIDPPWRVDPWQNIVNFSSLWVIMSFQYSVGNTGHHNALGPFTPQARAGHMASDEYYSGAQTGRFPADESGTFTIGTQQFDYHGAPFNPLLYSAAPWTLANLSVASSNDLSLKMAISGSPFLEYPNAAAPEAGWIVTTEMDLTMLGWKGTGPFDVYDNITGPFLHGMIADVLVTDFQSDDNSFVDPSHLNLSIYNFGDTLAENTQDFSHLFVVNRASGALYVPAAMKLTSLPFKDGTPLDGAGSSLKILFKRNI